MIVDWANFDSDYLFEILCPGSTTWRDPETQYVTGSGSRHIARCAWTVNGNATVRTRSK